MKPNRNPTPRNRERVLDNAVKPTQQTGGTESLPGAGVPERFRRLERNEMVFRGDFLASEHRTFEPWEGPGGFRAGTFMKPIYRRRETGRFRASATGKSKRNTNNP
jgi:hypothetical protein